MSETSMQRSNLYSTDRTVSKSDNSESSYIYPLLIGVVFILGVSVCWLALSYKSVEIKEMVRETKEDSREMKGVIELLKAEIHELRTTLNIRSGSTEIKTTKP